MAKLLSDRTAELLKRLLREQAPTGGGRGRGTGGSRWVFALCDDDVPVGGGGVLNECYPATLLLPSSVNTGIPDEGVRGVLLTVYGDRGQVVKPTKNAPYECLMLAEVESDRRTVGDTVVNGRPRVVSCDSGNTFSDGLPPGDLPPHTHEEFQTPVLENNGSLRPTPQYISTYPVNGAPASQVYQFAEMPGRTTSIPAVMQEVAKNGDGAGRPTVSQEVFPNGIRNPPGASDTYTMDPAGGFLNQFRQDETFGPAGYPSLFQWLRGPGFETTIGQLQSTPATATAPAVVAQLQETVTAIGLTGASSTRTESQTSAQIQESVTFGGTPATVTTAPVAGAVYHTFTGGTFDFTGATVLGVGGGGAGAAGWTKYTFTAASFSTAANILQIKLRTRPAGSFLRRVVLHHTAAFGGGALTQYHISVGDPDAAGTFISGVDVFVAPAGNYLFQTGAVEELYSFTVTRDILIQASCVGGNLNTATAGSVDVYIEEVLLGGL